MKKANIPIIKKRELNKVVRGIKKFTTNARNEINIHPTIDLSLIFLISINFLISKEFSKKTFIIFFTIFIFFNFSKNISRLIKTDEIFVGIQSIDNLYIKKVNYSNEYAEIFYPDIKKNAKNGWQGRLCWDIPFICSWEDFNINKKNTYLFLVK